MDLTIAVRQCQECEGMEGLEMWRGPKALEGQPYTVTHTICDPCLAAKYPDLGEDQPSDAQVVDAVRGMLVDLLVIEEGLGDEDARAEFFFDLRMVLDKARREPVMDHVERTLALRRNVS